MAKESSSPLLPAPADAYRDFLRDLKVRVLSARVQAARAVTRELVLRNWELTSPEFLRSAAVLSPGGKTSEPEKLSQAVREMVAQVPWGHYANILARVEDPDEKFYYLRATAEYGWSRNIIESP